MVFKNIRLFTKNWFLKIAQVKRKAKGLRYVRSTTIIKTAPNSTLNEKQHAANPIKWIDKEKLASFMDNRIIFSFSKNYDKNRSMTAFFFFFFYVTSILLWEYAIQQTRKTFDTYILLMYIESPSP